MNLISVLAKGGWLMIPIAAFSLIALGIFIERILVLRKARINLNAFLMKIRQAIGKKDYQSALILCAKTPGPIPKVLEKGIRLHGQSRELDEAKFTNWKKDWEQWRRLPVSLRLLDSWER